MIIGSLPFLNNFLFATLEFSTMTYKEPSLDCASFYFLSLIAHCPSLMHCASEMQKLYSFVQVHMSLMSPCLFSLPVISASTPYLSLAIFLKSLILCIFARLYYKDPQNSALLKCLHKYHAV